MNVVSFAFLTRHKTLFTFLSRRDNNSNVCSTYFNTFSHCLNVKILFLSHTFAIYGHFGCFLSTVSTTILQAIETFKFLASHFYINVLTFNI